VQMEIKVSENEFKRIKKQKKEVQAMFCQLDRFEGTLKALQLRFLMEKKRQLEEKFREIEEHYKQLLDFIARAESDKKLMMEFRKKLSEENRVLRKELRDKRWRSL